MMRSFLIITLVLINLNVLGQVRAARQEMQLYNYSGAIVLLEKAYGKGKPGTCREASGLLAECYRRQNKLEKAGEWYQTAISLGNEDPVNWYYLACCQRSCGDYISAKKSFLKFDSLVSPDPRGRTNAAFCDTAMAWQKLSPRYEVQNARGLNSPQSDFAAVLSDGMVFFVSDRLGKKVSTFGWTGNAYLRVYQAGIEQNDSTYVKFGLPVDGPVAFNQTYHDGPLCFNKTMDEVFINRTIELNDKGRRDSGLIRTHLLKIFHSVKKNGEWSKPEPFFLNNDSCSIGHPALSPDGNTLYFVSDMHGGYGGTDIWSCPRNSKGVWSRPVNLGKDINTRGNEMFPFIAVNGDLYFASDGLPGFGGLDIFVAKKDGSKWKIPVNLGQPVNSPADDFAFAPWGNGSRGTFSSNRPGGSGSDDIYLYRVLPVAGKLQPAPPPPDTSRPKPIPPGLAIGKTYRIENIYYDFDKWNIRRDAEHSLDSLAKIMKEYPVNVEIGSHTDCRGSAAYNETLSLKRAESVVSYLIGQGIDPSRLTAKGYGKSMLINRCNCSEGVQCTEAEHQENRRTEFKITGVNLN